MAATVLPPASPASGSDVWPDSVSAFQTMFNNKNDTTWKAADANVTVRLPNGSLSWIFGDTFRDGGAAAVHNSILVEQGDQLTSTTGGQAIPNDGNGDYYWPTDGIVDGGRLRVFVGRLGTVNGTFVSKGMGLASFGFDSRGYPTYSGKGNVTSADEDTGVQWGTSVTAGNDGYLYVYGQQRRLPNWGRDVYVARVPVGYLATASSWRFWNGSSWVTDRTRATRIEGAETGRFASSFSVDKLGTKFVVVSKENDFLGDKIIRMESAKPYGPFTTVSNIPTPGTDTQWEYQAKLHPEVKLGDGKSLVTWNNGTSDWNLLTSINFAKPQSGEIG